MFMEWNFYLIIRCKVCYVTKQIQHLHCEQMQIIIKGGNLGALRMVY